MSNVKFMSFASSLKRELRRGKNIVKIYYMKKYILNK